MTKIHQDEVQLSHSFNDLHSYLNRVGYVEAETSTGTKFKATSSITRDGRPAIIFFKKAKNTQEHMNVVGGIIIIAIVQDLECMLKL